MAGRVIEDQAGGSIVEGVFGKEDDGAVENSITKGRIREQELTVKEDRGIGWIGRHARKVDGRRAGCKLQHTKKSREWVSNKGNWRICWPGSGVVGRRWVEKCRNRERVSRRASGRGR